MEESREGGQGRGVRAKEGEQNRTEGEERAGEGRGEEGNTSLLYL